VLLKGLIGDAMNVVLAAAAANVAKLLRLLPCAVQAWPNRWTFAIWLAHHQCQAIHIMA
jgi:hypothetical protein